MALTQAVEFRNLAAQLTNKEVQVFASKLAQSDPQFIIQSLFSSFIQKSTNKNKDLQNERCNDIISTIIQSREDKCVQQNDRKFDTLPRRLIGRCASYLDYTFHAALSVCNRSIFLGCTTPIMFEELDLTYWSDSAHEQLDLSMFPFAKRLIINENESILSQNKMNTISSQIGKMRRLESLDLKEVNWEFIQIISKNEQTKQRTKSLSVRVCNSAEYEAFMASIPGFQYLQFLKLSLAWTPESATDSDINSVTEMCSNLKGLDFQGDEGGILPSILQKVGHQLQYLKLHDSDSDGLDLTQIDFANLLELKEGHCKSDAMRSVLKTATNLEKVKLEYGTDLIEEVIAKCKRLRYLEINNRGKVDDVLDALERGLYRTKKQQRNTLKIKMNADIEKMDAYIMKLNRIINELTVNPVDHWMIILDVDHFGTKTKSSIIKDLRCNLTAETAVVPNGIGDFAAHLILLTNTGCAICGWRESWLMNF